MLRNFKRDFLTALNQASAAYPAASVEELDGGLRLRRSPPPIAYRGK